MTYYKYKQKEQWLENIHKMILDFFHLHKFLYNSNVIVMTDEEWYMIDDIAAQVKNINDTIFYSSEKENLLFDSYNYSKKHYGYDAVKMEEYIQELREKIKEITIGETKRNVVMEYFETVYHELFKLNGKIIEEHKDLQLRISMINRSII